MVNHCPTVCVLCNCTIPTNGGNDFEGGFAHPACIQAARHGDRSPQVIEIVTGSGTSRVNKNGRCEDAPCCD
jgi:hypothetical protein